MKPDEAAEILQVGRSATPLEIKRAFRAQALRDHPDKQQAPRPEDAARFREIVEAQRVLLGIAGHAPIEPPAAETQDEAAPRTEWNLRDFIDAIDTEIDRQVTSDRRAARPAPDSSAAVERFHPLGCLFILLAPPMAFMIWTFATEPLGNPAVSKFLIGTIALTWLWVIKRASKYFHGS